MGRRNWAILICLLLFIGGMGAWYLAQARRAIIEVKAVKVKRGEILKSISASGKLEADEIDVCSKVSGTVSKLPVRDGEEVQEGQVLLELDREQLQLAVDQAWATYLNAKAQKDNLLKSIPSSTEMEAAQAQVNQAWQAYLIAENNYHNAPFDSTRLARDEAWAAYLSAKANLEKLKKQASRGQDLEAADAQINGAHASYLQAKSNLENAIIKAAMGGILNFKLIGAMGTDGSKVAVGSTITQGQSIFTIYDLSKIYFAADVDETDIALVEVGQLAQVALDAYPGMTFKGRVSEISATSKITQTGGTAFSVKIELEPTSIPLRIGMNGSTDIIESRKKNVLTVPYEAVVRRRGERVVFVVEDSIVRMRDVTTGISTETSYEIIRGLGEGERVAISGLKKLRDGSRVSLR
ncbi:MAG: efflux RND transporter periplasmic adaptor subunit [Actinomycetota bacterium]|nr:efflux RND transporter periplasmic adaptor subunit [Actinomycetota bacterium]